RLQGNGFFTFVATFTGPSGLNEAAFEGLLWSQLQKLHDNDASVSEWDASVSEDPDSPHFSWSFGGKAFFVVGLHPASSRFTRRFPFPTLVFNAHFQFEQLREAGKYERMQDVMRSRDTALQGTINPNLSDFGDASDARQYSGREVEGDWRCPFHARTGSALDEPETDTGGEIL
ncbi:MAG: YqcI/YcgG family protein, partial [Akkermansiaceae bacterium]|nr:YqcI/YcgG family protein [Armatimonadota bacterium]